MKLLPPGKRGPCWYIRGTVRGRPYEVSTGTLDAAEAADFLRRFLIDLPRRERAEDEASRRATPRAIDMGLFEQWLLEVFVLDGELVRWRHDRRCLAFYKTAGYLTATVPYLNYVKKVRKHRLKFLLAHGWLSETIDHIDRNPANNLLSNLEASTPAMQAANTRQGKTR